MSLRVVPHQTILQRAKVINTLLLEFSELLTQNTWRMMINIFKKSLKKNCFKTSKSKKSEDPKQAKNDSTPRTDEDNVEKKDFLPYIQDTTEKTG